MHLALDGRCASFEQLTQIQGQLHSTLITIHGILGYGTSNNGVEFARQILIEEGGSKRFPIGNLETDSNDAIALKRPIARDHVVQNHAQRKNIRSSVDR